MNAHDIVTWGIIAGTAVIWIAWDVVLGAKRQRTESWWLATFSREWNALPFTIGTLVGHWFVQNTDPDYKLWPVALSLLVLVLAWDLLCRPWSVKGALIRLYDPAKWMRYPGLWLLLGIPAGWAFWPQRLP